MLTGTDIDGLSCSVNFTVTYQSKPYLNRAIPDAQIRTNQLYQYSVPSDTFLQPDNLTMTYTFYDFPSWINFTNNTMTLAGTPGSNDVGVYTIVVTVVDTKNQSAVTSFQIAVIKNYAPVVQKQLSNY